MNMDRTPGRTLRWAIIIPVYNHGAMIGDVIRDCRPLGTTIFVIDDGSTDNTGAVLARTRDIVLLRHPENRGKGAALLTGFAAARQQGFDTAITLDGDGQHLPRDCSRLLAAAAQAPPCLVVGRRQRMEARAGVPWTSRFGRDFSNFWVRVSGGPRLGDSQSGFRLYPLPQVLELGVRSRRYQFEVEVLVRARQHRLPVLEVPVRVIYQPRGERVSHFRPWVDFFRNSWTFTRLITARIFRRPRP